MARSSWRGSRRSRTMARHLPTIDFSTTTKYRRALTRSTRSRSTCWTQRESKAWWTRAITRRSKASIQPLQRLISFKATNNSHNWQIKLIKMKICSKYLSDRRTPPSNWSSRLMPMRTISEALERIPWISLPSSIRALPNTCLIFLENWGFLDRNSGWFQRTKTKKEGAWCNRRQSKRNRG